MNRYMEGYHLSAKDIKYLALTSNELNMFIDHKEYQSYIEILSPEFINQLEVNISEQILENYRIARNIVTSRREEFYVKKNNRARSLINKKKSEIKKSRSMGQLLLDRKHQSLVKKAFIQKYFTDKYGKISKYPLFLKSKKSTSRQRSHMRIASQKSNMAENDIKLVAQRRAYSIDLTKKQYKASIYGNIPEEDYYKIKHPGSKIIPLSLCNNKRSEVEAILADQQKYRTRSFDRKMFGTTRHFFDAYSAGPFKGLKFEAKLNVENRNRAAIIIQKNYRGYKARRVINYMKMMNIEMLAGKIKASNLEAMIASYSLAKSKRNNSNDKKSQLKRQQTRKVAFAVEPQAALYRSISSYESPNNIESNKFKWMAYPRGQSISPGISRISSFVVKMKSKQKDNLDEYIIEKFHEAVKDNDLECVMKTDQKLLRKLINLSDSGSIFPIQYAIENNNLDMVIFFLENGLTLKKCGLTQESILSMANGRKHRRIREYFGIIFKQKLKHTRSHSFSNYVQFDV